MVLRDLKEFRCIPGLVGKLSINIISKFASSITVLGLFINQKIAKIHVVNLPEYGNVSTQEQNRKNVIKIHIDSNRFSIQMPIRISCQSVSRCSLLCVFRLVNNTDDD